MYLGILTLPLITGLICGLLGRNLGSQGTKLLGTHSIIIGTLISITLYYEIAISESPLSIYLLDWVDTEYLGLGWGLKLDSLSISIYIPVLIVSSCVHIYSIIYMSEDGHNARFYSYLSLFTFFMLVLISGDNLLLIFIGWEGEYNCLKWYNIENNLFLYSQLPIIGKTINKNLNNSNHNITPFKIGPHNIDVISIIIGSTLGDTHLEKRSNGVGTRLKFVRKSHKNVEYLMWFHKFYSDRGYCNPNTPKLMRRIRKKGKITFEYNINSYTYASFNWIHEMFYTFDEERKRYIKILPLNLERFLTPQALAVWFMDSHGGKVSSGFKMATNNFTFDEINTLAKILRDKYNLEVSVIKAGALYQYNLYISKSSMKKLVEIIEPHLHHEI